MARLCNSGSRIFKKFGHDGDYNWYFSLTREGAPLVEPYNIFPIPLLQWLMDNWQRQPAIKNMSK